MADRGPVPVWFTPGEALLRLERRARANQLWTEAAADAGLNIERALRPPRIPTATDLALERLGAEIKRLLGEVPPPPT